MPEIFSEQNRCAGGFGRGDDQGVPKRQLNSMPDVKRSQDFDAADRNHFEAAERLYLGRGLVCRYA